MSSLELPDKLYFRIGEAARLVGVRPYVLRYWETEFSDHLAEGDAPPPPPIDLAEVRDELLALCRLLEDKPAAAPIPLTIGTPAAGGDGSGGSS